MQLKFVIRRVPQRNRKLETVEVDGEIMNAPIPRQEETLVVNIDGREIFSIVTDVVYFYENGSSRAVIFSNYKEVNN